MSKSNQQDAGQTCGGTGRVVVGGGALSGPCPGCRECDPAPEQTCPTCGSDDPERDRRGVDQGLPIQPKRSVLTTHCPDPFHQVKPAPDPFHVEPAPTQAREGVDAGQTWTIHVCECGREFSEHVVYGGTVEHNPRGGPIEVCPASEVDELKRERDEARKLVAQYKRGDTYKTVALERDQALARAEAAEARLAEVEKARREIVDSVTGTLVHPEQARRIEAAVAALDRALNETKSQEEGS